MPEERRNWCQVVANSKRRWSIRVRKRSRPEIRAAIRPTAIAERSPRRSELLEDVDDAGEFENQQHDEHDSDHGENVAAGRHRVDPLIERPEFAVGERCNACLSIVRVYTEADHLLANGVLSEEAVDLVDARFARERLAELGRA